MMTHVQRVGLSRLSHTGGTENLDLKGTRGCNEPPSLDARGLAGGGVNQLNKHGKVGGKRSRWSLSSERAESCSPLT